MNASVQTDPFLREIFEMGFQFIEIDEIQNSITLRNSLKVRKYQLSDFNWTIQNCTVLGSESYRWIKDGDGSSERFKNFLLNNYIKSNSPSSLPPAQQS